VAPLCRRLDLEGLAALVEEKYPELNERLTTTVELAGKPNADYGSPALLALLVEQTERRTSGLNFWVAFPARASTWLAGSAAAVLILILFPVTVSSSYAELCQR